MRDGFEYTECYRHNPADDVYSAPFQGQCDGCRDDARRTVRKVTGPWGSAVVCRNHEDHE